MRGVTVRRCSDLAGSCPVSSFTVAELKRLDAGHRYTPDGGATFPFRGQGIRLSTLREVLTELGLNVLEAEVTLREGYANSFGLALTEDLGEYEEVLSELQGQVKSA